MSTTNTSTDIKILHQWEVTVTKEVDETTAETVNGQVVNVTRKVSKPVVTKMALKRPTRRELRAAELFYGKEFNKFVQMGFLPESIMRNKMIDISGGVISEKERDRAEKLTHKLVALEMDLARLATKSGDVEEEKKDIQSQMVAIRTELINLNAVKEAAFSQSAEARANSQLQSWFSFFLVYIDKNGKWVPYFEGESFDNKEEFMWKLEEDDDKFYSIASSKIATYVGWFSHGADSPEAFKAIDEEMAKQLNADKVKEDDVKGEPLATEAEEPAKQPEAPAA
jgi:hypothetical protein